MTVEKRYFENAAKSLVKKLEKRRFEAYYCEDKDAAREKALELIEEGASVAFGGSETIKQIGLVDAVDCEKYRTINRDKAKSPEEKDEMTRQAMTVDYYLMSPNALTQEGELVNIDGKGNRVAALCYGPKYVIVIAGMNKLAQDRENGIWRSQNIASPKNTLRIGKQTPCSVTGECGDCYGDESICSQIVITRRSGVKNRIKVILVGEELGY